MPESTELMSLGTVDVGEEGQSSETCDPEQKLVKESQRPLPDGPSSLDQVTSPKNSKQPNPDLSVVRLVQKADQSAGRLVNLLVKHFPSFRDETRFDGKRVRLLKRAQIFVADLWAAFNGTGYGEFKDIGELTIFAGEFSRANELERASHHLLIVLMRVVGRLSCATNAPNSGSPGLQSTTPLRS